MSRPQFIPEVFMDVVGYEGLYKVSDAGRVWKCERISPTGRTRRGRFLCISQKRKGAGYLFVRLVRDGEEKSLYIHRLVAVAFIMNPERKTTVNHINGVKSDNRLKNLEWATHIENLSHAWRTGLSPKTRPRLTTAEVVSALEMLAKGKTLRAVGKAFGVSLHCIWRLAAGKTKTYAGVSA